MLTIFPTLRFIIEKITARQKLNVPVRSVSMTSCHSSGFIITKGRSRVMPALFTSAVMGPCRPATSLTVAFTAARSVASQAKPTTWGFANASSFSRLSAASALVR